jgi:hypothetical protein
VKTLSAPSSGAAKSLSHAIAPKAASYNRILQAAISSPKPVSTSEAGVPWYVWCSVAAVTSCMIGVHWDISRHESIGRDTFWTPAHLAILCGILAGIASAYLILSTTFDRQSPLRKTSVRMWGFHGPFDDWWHRAYGLDVKILSPPHAVLALVPLVLPRISRATGYKWAATAVAGVYTAFLFLIGRILALFPAQPKLGPVYRRVTHFVPPEFTADWPRWRQSVDAKVEN